jgi:putative flippase GtrA
MVISRQAVKQYAVFITGGGVGALVKWLISFGLTSLLGVYYMAALLVAEVVNIAVNYTWHRYITFGVRGRVFRQFVRFFLLSSATVLLSLALVFMLKEYALDALGEIVVRGVTLNYLAAIVVVTFVVSLINYLVSRLWIFVTDAANPPGGGRSPLPQTIYDAEKEHL